MAFTIITTLAAPFTARSSRQATAANTTRPTSSSSPHSGTNSEQSARSHPGSSSPPSRINVASLKNSFSREAISQRTKAGLEEVKLKTIYAKRLDKSAFAYAVQKREEAYQSESEMMYLNPGERVESWLGSCEEEEPVKQAARSVASRDGEVVLGRITSGEREYDPSLNARF